MYTIPTAINIDGMEYKIRNDGDFRVILDCFRALEDIELDAKERLLACLIIFYADLNSIEDVENVPNLKLRFLKCISSLIAVIIMLVHKQIES